MSASTEPAPQPTYRDGIRAAAPLAVVVFGFGVSFGVLARAAGMGTLAPVVMSITTFGGSAQFAAVSVLGAGGGVAAAVAAAVLLNSRYLPIGLSAASAFRGSVLRRVAESQLVVDESWAIGHQGHGRFDRRMLLGAGIAVYVGWVAGTAIGVLGSSALGNPSALGLDAAFPALFLGLLASQVRSRRALAASAAGAAIALVLVPAVPAGLPIVAASAACLIGLGRS